MLVERRWLLAVLVVALVGFAAVWALSSSTASIPVSTNVYVDPGKSSCNGGSTFSCTIVLDAKQGVVTVAEVKSVVINGTNTQHALTATGGSVTVVATVPSISMVRGLGDVGPSQRPPSVGDVVIYLTDGTQVSAMLGPGGLI